MKIFTGFAFAAAPAALVFALLTAGVSSPVRAQGPDPCAAALSAPQHGGAPHERRPAGRRAGKLEGRDHDDRWSHLDSLWAHRAAVAHHHVSPSASNALSQDVGDVAVLQDAGDLVITPNPLDLGGLALRFTPNGAGGYDVSRRPLEFRQPVGAALTLSDDDTREVDLPFEFTLFRQRYAQAFVNSDGNVTFGEGDDASSPRTVSRLLAGPPRVAPFLADLDPSTGGRVLTFGDAGGFTVTWCGVNGFESDDKVTVQATLRVDGTIDMQFGQQTTLKEAVVGLSPGRTASFTPVDLSADAPSAGGSAAVGERFATAFELDTLAVSRRFLASHPDDFDNIVMFTDDRLLRRGAFAVEISVKNTIRGLNLPVFDLSREYGSAGRLQSLCHMDWLEKYGDDPQQRILGENSTLSVLGQEVGHRWLAFLEFRDHAGQRSKALLGRDESHWSFFFDSDGSVVEGNDIEQLPNGTFRTVGAVERYSLLDQYAMGLVDATQVPPFFYVENPRDINPHRDPDSAPRSGVTFAGTRRDVTIDDVIAVLGRRVPASSESPRVYRQAFVYVASAGHEINPANVAKVDRIRVEWEQFFSRATDSRMRAETHLRIP